MNVAIQIVHGFLEAFPYVPAVGSKMTPIPRDDTQSTEGLLLINVSHLNDASGMQRNGSLNYPASEYAAEWDSLQQMSLEECLAKVKEFARKQPIKKSR